MLAKGEKVCWVCGIAFTPAHGNHKVCGNKCKKRAKAIYEAKARSLEIQAEIPSGAPENVVRTVTGKKMRSYLECSDIGDEYFKKMINGTTRLRILGCRTSASGSFQPSAASVICSGRLLRAVHLPPSSGFGAQPNFVAITT